MLDNRTTLENICRLLYCVALADNKLLASEFSKLNEQIESLVDNVFKDLDYDEKVLEAVIHDVNHQAKILSPQGNIEDAITHFLVAISESITDQSLRKTILNQCFTIAVADLDLTHSESRFIKKLSQLWDLEDLYHSSVVLAGSFSK